MNQLLLIIITIIYLKTCASSEITCDASDEEGVFEKIVSNDFEKLDEPILSNTIQAIKERGGHKCWHKHSTFLDHLVSCHNILRLWGENEIVGRVGLLHSAYSNSYVNLALFDRNTDRPLMKSLIGEEAEELVYLFCIIDRQDVVVNQLLSTGSIPEAGISVKHLRDPNVQVHLTAEVLRMLLVFTMADVADQYFGWQDLLFGGTMLVPDADDTVKHFSQALWPGESRPGIWMSYVSELCQVAKTYHGHTNIPPVFNNCSEVLTQEDEQKSIDSYWSVIHGNVSSDEVISVLLDSVKWNPWYFEGHVLLAQKYLHVNDNENAAKHTELALRLQRQWGCAYDKRMGFQAWVAWTRVLDQRARDKMGWPENSWDVNNFGMVY